MIDLPRKNTTLILAVLLAATLMITIPSDCADGENTNLVLFDSGNGETEWVPAASGTSYGDVLKKTAESAGISYDGTGILTVYGISSETIGSAGSGGSLTVSGTTGKTSVSVWTAYRWNTEGGTWEKITDLGSPYNSEHLALAFYPEGIIPAQTPELSSSWTMFRGNAAQDGHQYGVEIKEHEAAKEWEFARGGTSGVYAGALHVGKYVFAKFGAGKDSDPAVICFELGGSDNPEKMKKWEFTYSGQENYETATPAVVGQYIYVQSSNGYIYRFPWIEGPGEGNANVIVSDKIPEETGTELAGDSFGPGIGSLVYDSGALYFLANNGMVYCFDLDLNLLWSRQMGGHNYYVSPTVKDGYVFTGSKDGCIYVLDKHDGKTIASAEVFTVSMHEKTFGNVSVPAVFADGDRYTLVFTVSDGRGMSSTAGGAAIYEFDAGSKTLTKKFLNTSDFGLVGAYTLPLRMPDFEGVVFVGSKGIFKLGTDGNFTLLNDTLYSVKAPPVLVNGTSIYLASYAPWRPIYEMNTDGEILSLWTPDVEKRNYCMSPVLFVEGTMLFPSDSSLTCASGTFPEYVPPASESSEKIPLWMTLLIVAAVLIIALILIYVVMRFGKGIEKPFAYIGGKISHYLGSDELGHNRRSKHRLLTAFLIGLSLTAILFITSLCVGPTKILSVPEMFSSLFSAISKGGERLDYSELMVFESRLPRTLAAFSVGIGLSIAGAVYQAVIRNPLVDPYIMGVSAGAGTAAVAVIAFDFTFFGLFAQHSLYVTAFSAIIGGLAAFAATMFIAEKSGGTSINYVLAGVIIGLAFSAVQTLMLSMAGHRVSNALSWLFGSFANVSWNQVWLILIPALTLSLVPLIWAKELNLVLLGEEQAQQMGLNVIKFNRFMLIIASVLTSICVAFVGIIGFVGLVIPHLCRMMFGGDHRLVLPASIAFGGALMMAADLVARMAYSGLELPVGAITTFIGVPVFAYLLVKRGKMYEG